MKKQDCATTVGETPASTYVTVESDAVDPSQHSFTGEWPEPLGPVVEYVSIGRPSEQHSFRTHPNPSFVGKVWGLRRHGRFDDDVYLVEPEIRAAMGADVERWLQPVLLIPYVLDDGEFGLWPVLSPGPWYMDQSTYHWSVAAASLARTQWVRMGAAGSRDDDDEPQFGIWADSDMRLEPCWPRGCTTDDMVRIGFNEESMRVIRDVNHPVMKELLG